MKGWGAALIFIVAVSLYAWWYMQKPLVHTDRINQAFTHIIKAETVADRELALNDALEQMHLKADVKMGNGNFYLALGDVYMQLNAFPWASWSYRQAENLAPAHPIIMERIVSVDKALQLKPASEDSIFDQLLFFHQFSLPRRLQLFTLCLSLAFAFLSVAIWQRQTLWIVSGTVFGSVALLFLLSSLYTRYVEPVRAVAIEGALVLAAPSNSAPMVGNSPVSAGSALLVMNINEDGRFVKVLTDEGTIGYVPIQKLKLIH